MLIQPRAYAVHDRGDMLAHRCPVRAGAFHLDLRRLGKQTLVAVSDDLHHTLRQPSFEQLDDRAHVPGAPCLDPAPMIRDEWSDANAHVVQAGAGNQSRDLPRGDFQVERAGDRVTGAGSHSTLDLWALWGEPAQARGAEFVVSVQAFAQPAGITVRSAYEELRDEILNDLHKAMPVDVVLLMLHGAMVAEGYEDCEEDILSRVRAIVGTRVTVAVELDLHCHLSDSKIVPADIVLTYREYPHTDIQVRARQLFGLAVAAQLGSIRPTMVLVDCQMVGMYPTTREPLQGMIGAMTRAEERPGVLAISFGHGFQFADLPHVGAKVLVVTDNDVALARRVAEEFAYAIYALRRQIGFESIAVPIDDALTRALASQRTPVVVADQSDNVGGGAPGDSTFALRWLLKRSGVDAAIGIVYDPEVVRIARKVGRGARVVVRLGGKLGSMSGEPVDLAVTVGTTLSQYRHAFPQGSGEPWYFESGDVVALKHDAIDVVVSTERCQCFAPSIFDDLGISSKDKRILIPKSYQHFHGAFASIAAEVIYMAAPGAVPPDPRKIFYTRLNTSRLFPWVEDPLGRDER